jgi:hypothetical protein
LRGGLFSFPGQLGFLPPPLILTTNDSSTFNIFGSFNYGNGPIADSSVVLTSTLADGSPITLDFTRSGNSEIIVNPISEPVSLTLLGLGVGALLGYPWRRRKAA